MPDKNIRDKIQVGMKIRLRQRIKEENAYGEENERTQLFEGTVISRKHGKEKGATITVRKVVKGVGVEKIFPIYSPIIEDIEILKRKDVSQSQPYYLRDYGKKVGEEQEKEQQAA